MLGKGEFVDDESVFGFEDEPAFGLFQPMRFKKLLLLLNADIFLLANGSIRRCD